MPSRNSTKTLAEGHYYHVYNRGASKQPIFRDENDYTYFLHLLKRHLGTEESKDKYDRPYRHLRGQVDLLCYCLMPNHFHLLLLNKESDGIEQLMRSLSTAYSMYFNKKYQHSGHIFQGVYKASMIDHDSYLQHISRYILRNPDQYKSYSFSSYNALSQEWNVDWLATDELLQTFEGARKDFLQFIDDYEDYKNSLEDLEYELADR